MKNLSLTLCLVIVALFGSVGGVFASDLPPCPSSGVFHNCFGTWTFEGGDKYVGEWKDDKYHGQGTYTSADGEKYVGEYKDDKRNGQGTFTFANGHKYVGEFKDGKQHGQGTYTSADGEKYVGEFKDDLFNGQGTYTSADGTLEEGIWKDGEFQYAKKLSPPVPVAKTPIQDDEIISESSGSDSPECSNSAEVWHDCFGTKTYENGDKYVGDFEDNKKHGEGTYTWVNEDKYIGEWKDNKQHGQGTKTWVNGDKYVGEFKKDMQNGLGVYTQSDGTIEDGIYLDDELLYFPSLIIRWFRGVKG